MHLIDELSWRGLLHDNTPGVREQLDKEMTTGYVGFDPTADSLHIGNLVPIILLMHLQRAGHRPIALVGGATGRVGDPSGKTEERKFLDVATIQANLEAQKKQLMRFLDFDCGTRSAQVVNNYDWFENISFLDFIRDVGKHITVNYMLSKDSVKKRLETGMSFTEFTYQLIQGYDFFHLWKNMEVKLQMGGSDQWGNIVTGTELIRRLGGGEAHALTAPLITKADGSKFGKSEGGNVWLDKTKTSPYTFYQYWLNTSDEDAARYIKIFTFLPKEEIDGIIAVHTENPSQRVLQKRLAEEITRMVHSEDDLQTALAATDVLFGRATRAQLQRLSANDLLSVFEGVPQATVQRTALDAGIGIVDALATQTGFMASNSEARRALKENSIQVNKEKVGEDYVLDASDLLCDRYVLLQRGKKNYYLLVVG